MRKIFADPRTLQELRTLSPAAFCVVADFDGTLSSARSPNTWTALFQTPDVGPEFRRTCEAIDAKYRPYETRLDLAPAERDRLMAEWYREDFAVLSHFKISRDAVKQASRAVKLRRGARWFLTRTVELGIPVAIVSAGIGNVIKAALRRARCDFANISVISNFLDFDDAGRMRGLRFHQIVTPAGKDRLELPAKLRAQVRSRVTELVFGDLVLDAKMTCGVGERFTFGFLNTNIENRLAHFRKHFDVIGAGDVGFDELLGETMGLFAR